MGTEIEHKYLTDGESWRELATGINYRQGYLNSSKGRTVRVRTMDARACLTIKGPAIDGARLEYEYAIPLADANEMLEKLCLLPVIEKRRYAVPYQGFTWEVDEFSGENSGLIVAEIELSHVGQDYPIPPWIGVEVTGDPRFYNANLVSNPFKNWRDQL